MTFKVGFVKYARIFPVNDRRVVNEKKVALVLFGKLDGFKQIGNGFFQVLQLVRSLRRQQLKLTHVGASQKLIGNRWQRKIDLETSVGYFVLLELFKR